MSIRAHLFLVHNDVIPNITPALDPRFRPTEVWLLSAPEMRGHSERLARILREAGAIVDHWNLDDAWDIERIRERVLEFVAVRDGGDIALNVSGGTRPMSLAAYEVFRSFDKPIYYVHPEMDHVVWLHPREWLSFDLIDRIKLTAFFAANDLRVADLVREGVPEGRHELTRTLVNKVGRWSSAIGVLNAYAAAATNRN